jgi:hypothetical protein
MPHPPQKLFSHLVMRNGAINAESSTTIAKRLRPNMVLMSLMAYTALRLHSNVKRKIINSRFLTLKNFILYPVLIVAKKNAKNGKNN